MSLAPRPDEISSASPQIAPQPRGAERRLIDNGLLHYEASLAGYAERYGRGETSHTIHVWWARRPHSAMRALVFASLCNDTSPDGNAVLRALPFDGEAIEAARAMLHRQYGAHPPRVLDMFGGGGTIPAESANLGAATYAIDANELSVFIQRCNLVYSQEGKTEEITTLVREAGTRVLEQLRSDTAELFPLRARTSGGDQRGAVFGYLWSYRTRCPGCGYGFYLIKRPWVSKKRGRNLALVLRDAENAQQVSIERVHDDYEIASAFIGRSGSVRCPRCEQTTGDLSIKRCDDQLVALVTPAPKSGKEFIPVEDGALPAPGAIARRIEATLAELGCALPASTLPRWSGIVNPAIYGIETHADFLNERQRCVLLLLIRALRDEYETLRRTNGKETARYVIGLLSSFIDQLVDWNCRLSMWIPQNEQVGRAFCGPGVSMLWDYVETDPVLDGPANLWSKLDRIISGMASIPKFPVLPTIQQGYAQKLPFAEEFFDAIVTDPPYYDNIYYNVLADFFFSWKRLLFQHIEPELFKGKTTDDSRELVASRFRSGSSEQAHADYCAELSLALQEAARVLKGEGVFSFVYSHSSLLGWQAIVHAFRSTSFRITSVQPLSIERKARPRAVFSEAINTCITFVCHKSGSPRPCISIEKLREHLRAQIEEIVPQLIGVHWAAEDIALACYANGVAMLVNADRVSGVDDDVDALRQLERVVQERFSTFRVQDRRSL